MKHNQILYRRYSQRELWSEKKKTVQVSNNSIQTSPWNYEGSVIPESLLVL